VLRKTIVIVVLLLKVAVGVLQQSNVCQDQQQVHKIRLALEDLGNLEVALHANHLVIAENA